MDCISEIHASSYDSEDRILRLETDMLQSLLNWPWFNHLWVLQEVVMSQSAVVFYGGKSVPWAALISFYTWNISSHWIERIPYVVSQISDDDSSRLIEEILLNILVKTRHCASTDPRDKIYALLPLAFKSCPRFEANAELRSLASCGLY